MRAIQNFIYFGAISTGLVIGAYFSNKLDECDFIAIFYMFILTLLISMFSE